jgi:hypothetical protein
MRQGRLLNLLPAAIIDSPAANKFYFSFGVFEVLRRC